MMIDERASSMHKLSLVIFVSLALISTTAAAQIGRDANLPGFSFVTPKLNPDELNHVMATTTAMPGGKFMIINKVYDSTVPTYRYKSYVIKSTGAVTGGSTIFSTGTEAGGSTGFNTGGLTGGSTILSTYYAPWTTAAAVWIEDTGTTGAATGHMLVYILAFQFGSGTDKCTLNMLRLDSKGVLMGSVQKIAEYATDLTFTYPSIRASRGGEEVLVALSLTEYTQIGNNASGDRGIIHLVRTNLKGAAIGRQAVSLGTSGDYQKYVMFNPHWTGTSWFVPVWQYLYTYNVSLNSLTATGHALNVLAATPSGAKLKVSLRRVYQDSQLSGDIDKASFVPMSGGTAGAAVLDQTLVFGTTYRDEGNTTPLEGYMTSLYLRTISAKGSPKGKLNRVPLPKRSHTISEYDSSLYWYGGGTGELSNVALNKADEPVICIFRGSHIVKKSDNTDRKWDTEMGIYRLDLQKGSVKVIQWTNTTGLPAGYLFDPVIIETGGTLVGVALSGEYVDAALRLFAIK